MALKGPGLSCCPDPCLSHQTGVGGPCVCVRGSGLSGRLRPLCPSRAHFLSRPLTFLSLTFSPAHLEATLAPSLTSTTMAVFGGPGRGLFSDNKSPKIQVCPKALSHRTLKARGIARPTSHSKRSREGKGLANECHIWKNGSMAWALNQRKQGLLTPSPDLCGGAFLDTPPLQASAGQWGP